MSEKAAGRKAFKDWFDEKAAASLADQIGAVHPKFDRSQFIKLATSGLFEKEFHARVEHFSNALLVTLPKSPPAALKILRKSLPPELPDTENVTDGWLQWPIGKFIADHGIDHFEESFETMIELTKRFSAEFAIRPFVVQYPERTMRRVLELTSHPNAHVRRLCSEGTRPLLPWGQKLHALIADSSPVLPVLEALKDDTSRYVTRSVANHLNDIAKNDPDLVISICRRWSEEASTERKWLIKHALRSLLKSGHPKALEILGFGPPRDLAATLSSEPETIAIGESIQFCAEIENRGSDKVSLMVDYVVHFVKKTGNAAPKVFKWKTLDLVPGESAILEKKQTMKHATIRTLYPGNHRVELQINGVRLAESDFDLSDS